MSEWFDNLFIFEMANNHQGSLDHGKKIVDAMTQVKRKHGIKAAIKLQYRDLDTFIHRDFRDGSKNNYVPRFLSTRLSEAEFRSLSACIRDAGMGLVITPFDEASVQTAMDHDVDVIKVASCSATDWPLLAAVAETRRPVICSTGGKNPEEIDNIYNFFTHRNVDFALLHCVSLYPTPRDALNLHFMDRLKRRYREVVIGYSGHEEPHNTDVAKIAVAKGAKILERHVGLPTEEIKLNAYSLSPKQVDEWVSAVKIAMEVCGVPDDKPIREAEIESLRDLSRGVFANTLIREGETLDRSKVYFAFPCVEGQITSGQHTDKLIASRDYAVDDPILEVCEKTIVELTRKHIHEYKGFFAEARIKLGEEFEVELSHHYGLRKFPEFGALLVTLVNREYCKKLVSLIPGQVHPVHRHIKKEETFHVLWGDLQVTLNSEFKDLKAGDILLINRGDWHGFTTRSGVVFEEISTKWVRGDSYYHDKKIDALDPMERKTVLEDW